VALTNQDPELSELAQQDEEGYIVYFRHNQSFLTNTAKMTISQIAKKIINKDDYEITINGHSDKSGNEDYNFTLSKRRALSVKNSLIERNIPKEKMTIFAYGETRSLISTKDGIAKKENRRVEIFIEYK